MSRLKNGASMTFMDGINAAGLQEPFTTACWLLIAFVSISLMAGIMHHIRPHSWWGSVAIIAASAALFQVFCLLLFAVAA